MIKGTIRILKLWLTNLNRPLSIWWRCRNCNQLVFDNFKSRKNHIGHEKLRWARLNAKERFLIRWGLLPELYE